MQFDSENAPQGKGGRCTDRLVPVPSADLCTVTWGRCIGRPLTEKVDVQSNLFRRQKSAYGTS
eukprot:3114109-Amphidinium_carterae.1